MHANKIFFGWRYSYSLMIRKTFRAKSFWLVKFCWCIIYYYWEDNLTRLVSKWQSTLFLLLTPAKRLPIHVLLRYTSKLNNLRKWRQQHSLYEFWRPMEYLGYIMVSLLRYVDRYLIRYSTSFLISRIIWIIKEIIMHPCMCRDTFYQNLTIQK